MTTIQNELLKVSITETGVEIASVLSLIDEREYIWQADPAIWGSHAPVLFPIIGGLKNNQYHFNGNTFPLPKHGFIRNNPNLKIIEQGSDFVTFEFRSSPALKLIYPFDFSFRITYRLDGSSLLQEYLILNEGEQPIYFSLGGHPAFRVPHFEGEDYSDYYLEFTQPETSVSYTVNAAGLIGPDTRPVPWQNNHLPLTQQLFSQDALVLKDLKSREVKLVSRQSGPILSVSYSDFDYLGIWAKTNGNFVCIEPWLGVADNHDTDGNLITKEGIIALGGLSTYSAAFVMTFYT